MSDPIFTLTTTTFGLTQVGQGASPTFVDIDDDGDLDAFIGSIGGTSFFENTGSASSPVFVSPSTNPFGLTNVSNADPTFVDIDGDGDLDAFIGFDSGETRFFENTGSANNPLFIAGNANPFGFDRCG